MLELGGEQGRVKGHLDLRRECRKLEGGHGEELQLRKMRQPGGRTEDQMYLRGERVGLVAALIGRYLAKRVCAKA